MTKSSTKLPPRQWSTEMPHTSTATTTNIFRSFDPFVSPQLGSSGCQTLYEAIRRGCELNPLGPCLGYRAISSSGFATPYVYSSYTEVVARVEAVAAGLQALNLVGRNDDGLLLLGIYVKNCVEWTIAEHAIYTIGGATVPLYDTLGSSSVEFILTQTALTACVCSRSQLPSLCEAKRSGQCTSFQHAILIDGVIPEAYSMAKEVGIQVVSFAKVETHGAQVISSSLQGFKHSPPNPTDVCTFCYTSGTTGNPKGALITHANALSAMGGIDIFFERFISDRHLSYLPLPHIFERMVLNGTLLAGASVAFFRGDPAYLIEDMQACRPTIFPAAPRVLNKIHDKIMAGMHGSGGMKLALFRSALKVKTESLKTKGQLTHALYDALIFNKIKKALGMDCIRFMLSGSAPLSENVMVFFRCLLGVPVVEGYGQTEGSAGGSMGHPEDLASVGHVGSPAGCCEIVLADVPEMGYLHEDTSHDGRPCRGRGEIWIRGPNVFQGYYKEEDKTKEVMGDDGWLKTGDIGLWTMQGQLQIVDRKKNIFKLSQGEYVSAEKIENILTRSLFISQCFVYGDSFQSTLVAVVVPDEDVVKKWASGDTDAASLDMAALCRTERLEAKIMTDIQNLSKSNGLQGFETVKAIYIEPEVFSVENDLVTPTFKLKRHQLRNRYQKEIDELYGKMHHPLSKL